MNHSPKPHAELTALATICHEAVQRHGDDWRAVNTHIRRCVDALPKDRRELLATEVGRVLRYCAPEGGSRTQ